MGVIEKFTTGSEMSQAVESIRGMIAHTLGEWLRSKYGDNIKAATLYVQHPLHLAATAETCVRNFEHSEASFNHHDELTTGGVRSLTGILDSLHDWNDAPSQSIAIQIERRGLAESGPTTEVDGMGALRATRLKSDPYDRDAPPGIDTKHGGTDDTLRIISMCLFNQIKESANRSSASSSARRVIWKVPEEDLHQTRVMH